MPEPVQRSSYSPRFAQVNVELRCFGKRAQEHQEVQCCAIVGSGTWWTLLKQDFEMGLRTLVERDPSISC